MTELEHNKLRTIKTLTKAIYHTGYRTLDLQNIYQVNSEHQLEQVNFNDPTKKEIVKEAVSVTNFIDPENSWAQFLKDKQASFKEAMLNKVKMGTELHRKMDLYVNAYENKTKELKELESDLMIKVPNWVNSFKENYQSTKTFFIATERLLVHPYRKLFGTFDLLMVSVIDDENFMLNLVDYKSGAYSKTKYDKAINQLTCYFTLLQNIMVYNFNIQKEWMKSNNIFLFKKFKDQLEHKGNDIFSIYDINTIKFSVYFRDKTKHIIMTQQELIDKFKILIADYLNDKA